MTVLCVPGYGGACNSCLLCADVCQVADEQGSRRKKIAGIAVAVCTATAGLATFLTNTTTIAHFFTGDQVSGVANTSPAATPPPSATSGPSVAVEPSTATSSSGAPRTRVVAPIEGSGVTPMPYAAGDPQQSVPDPFVATWSGVIFQRGSTSSTYPVKIEISGGQPGDQIARVRYDTLGCGGVWRLQAAWTEAIRSTESIQNGRMQCLDNVTITLSMQPDGQAYYEFSDSVGAIGEGVLHKA